MINFSNSENLFKGKHFSNTIVIWAVRWYCRFALSYRDLVLMAKERGIDIAHTTMMRWVHTYAPILKKRLKQFLKKSNNSWRTDETYIKVKGKWHYLYRAIDSKGKTLDWMLSKERDKEAAEEFFKETLENDHVTSPRVIGVDKNAAYPPAFDSIKESKLIPKDCELRQVKYLNNIIEQDHRFPKRKIRHSQWFQSFETAQVTIDGYESMHMIHKNQVEGIDSKDFLVQKKFIENIFGIAA